MDKRCVACGGQLERGVIRARNTSSVLGVPELGTFVSAFAFVRPGIPTSANPIKAFFHGLREEPGEEQQLTLEVFRCVACGRVDLYATEGPTASAGLNRAAVEGLS
jgi:hypothetical protein